MAIFINKNEESTAIANSFIDKYLPIAKPEYVVVYIFALRHAFDNKDWSDRDIASRLGINADCVKQAFEYWRQMGLVSVSKNTITFEPVYDESRNASLQSRASGKDAMPQTSYNLPDSLLNGPPEYNSADVFKSISSDKNLKEMFDIAQTILGKNLTPNEAVTLYSFCDWLGFKTEVVLLLLEYCVSQNKKSLKYIEKVAISWHEMNLVSVEAIDDYINTQKQRKNFIYSVCKMLGIENRRLTPTEQKYINDWHDNRIATLDMIAYAYDECVSQTGKLAMAYIDKILKRWHSEGITTPEQILADKKNHMSNRTSAKPAAAGLQINNTDKYDFDKMRKQAAQNLKEYLPNK